MEKEYLIDLDELSRLMEEVEPSPYVNYVKVQVLTTMNMRYEKVAFNHSLQDHPYILTKQIIKDSIIQFKWLSDISFIESDDIEININKSDNLKEKHEELWQEIWSRHNDVEFQEFVDLKSMRLEINDLVPLCQGEECVDFGCGNGSFAFALMEKGAKSVYGIDFGEKQVGYAKRISESRNLDDQVTFRVGNVKNTGFESDRFGFAVSNGVFHHLHKADIPKALNEVARVLRPGGWFWYYMDGKGSISHDLWDRSVEMLRDVDILFIEKVLAIMNISRNKMVHIMDDLSATYLHHDYDEVVSSLTDCGFTNFRRLSGGTDTDFDLDVVETVPYGIQKFGSGDIRVICQLK